MRKYFTRGFAGIFMVLVSSPLFASDIGVTGLGEPVAPFCPGTQNVSVILFNYGTDTVFSASVQWTVNGVGQPTALFSGTLAPGASQSVLLGTYFFNRKGTYDIDATSLNPNGAPDTNPFNDDFFYSGLKSRMSGNYSAGIVADYADVRDAVDDLSLRGVCDAVVININPGIFQEQLVIPEIAGASSLNTITFQSSTADSLSVIITFPSDPAPAANYTVLLDGADYIIFNQVTLERSGSQHYAHVVALTRQANSNTFTHLRISGASAVTDDSLAACVFSDSLYTNNSNAVSTCVIAGGASGIYMQGKSPALPDAGTLIENNRFEDQVAEAISLTNQSLAAVRGNEVMTTTGGSDYTGILCTSCTGKTSIEKNKIELVPGKGMMIQSCNGNAISRNRIVNNFISCTDSVALKLSGNSWLDVAFNSLHQVSPDTLQTALHVKATSHINLVNNVWANSGGGYAVMVPDSFGAGSYVVCNDLFTVGNFPALYDGNRLTKLGDWLLATGKDSGAVSVDPGYVSSADLHATAWQLDGTAKTFGNISDDIDGELRQPAPDIGADEFTAQVHDLSVTAAWPGDSACGDSVAFVRAVIYNPGSFSETSFLIHADVNGAVTASLNENYTATLNAGASDTVVFQQAINTTAGGIVSVTAYVSLSFDVHAGNDTVSVTDSLSVRLPPAAATGDERCGPGIVTLTASGTSSLSWYDNLTGGPVLGMGSIFSFSPSATDTMYVQNGTTCPSARTLAVALVHPLPAVDLGNDTMAISPATVTLSADSGYSSYSWNTGDTTNSIVVSVSGMYSVSVTDSYGCIGTDSVLVTIITGVQDLSQGSLHAWLDEGSDRCILHWTGSGGMDEFVLFDAVGRRVRDGKLNGSTELSFETGIHSEGLYILWLRSGEKWVAVKLAKP